MESLQLSKNFSLQAEFPKATHAPAGKIGFTFSQLRKQNKRALIPYLSAGDPTLQTTSDALQLISARGADVIELGIPCSNPFADGPIIQNSVARSLKNGTRLDSVLDMLSNVVPSLSAPIILLAYSEILKQRGVQNFFKDIRAAGVSGLIVPDLPHELTTKFADLAFEHEIELVLLATPTTTRQKMQEIAALSRGFIYLVSTTGKTGPRCSVNPQVELLLKELKELTNTPVAVGFGISKPEQAAQIAKWGGDGAIVGSAVVRILSACSSPDDGLAQLGDFISRFRKALDEVNEKDSVTRVPGHRLNDLIPHHTRRFQF